MVHRLQTLIAGVTLGGCWLVGGPLSASSLTVTNPGFVATVNSNFTFSGTNYLAGSAIPPNLYVNTLDGTSTGNLRKQSDDTQVAPGVTATVTGWQPLSTPGSVANARAGVANFGPGDVGNLVTLGTFSNLSSNVGFSQTLPGSVQLLPGFRYTLAMDLSRLTYGLPPTFLADLTVGGTNLNGTLVYNPPPNDSTPGSATVTYNAGNAPLAGNLGIIISVTDLSGTLTRILVDNITLDASIPEPGTLLLLSVGGCLVCWRRRRRG